MTKFREKTHCEEDEKTEILQNETKYIEDQTKSLTSTKLVIN